MEDYNGILLESAQIDLEYSQQLLPSPTRSDIIGKHLASIRAQFPKMKDIIHDSKWMAGRLVTTNCKKTIDECAQLINATEYGPMEASVLDESCDSFLFVFEKPYNPVILGPMIADLCECLTEPSYFGVDGTVQINVFGENEAKYTFSRTLGKSPSGHTYKHFWKYSVAGDGVNFVVHLDNEWEKESALN